MSNLEQLKELYKSKKTHIKIRAANQLLMLSDDVSLTILLNILDNLSNEGLGAKTEKILLKRRDPELVTEMIDRLKSGNNFVREVACKILGQFKNRTATVHLLERLDDPSIMVRLAAIRALAEIRDPAAKTALSTKALNWNDQDTNEQMAIQSALKSFKNQT